MWISSWIFQLMGKGTVFVCCAFILADRMSILSWWRVRRKQHSEVTNWQKVYCVPKCFFYMSVPVAKLVGASRSCSPTADFPSESHLPGGPWVTSSQVQVGLGSLDFLPPVFFSPRFHESSITCGDPTVFWNMVSLSKWYCSLLI